MTPEADRTTVYEQIARPIRQRIVSGDLAEGDPVPSLAEIQREWGVSVMTARRAIGVLLDEGRVQVRPGLRTVVASARTVPASSEVAAELHITPGDPVRVQATEESVTYSRI